ncbi:MFS transporter [Mycolicibacterium smegmatis]|uniref:Major facilitator family protein transporter n=3 Tax=Mycolicibacterium smegmatis TaxID=1772 RepID=A0QNN1_MYCS2|nr:MFS transporter [Mycolicibacterium smegmatis]ABK71320.1 major facilitator family protein transporter [Mycolicibacterium smegmatis MC2 155]AFP36581.1 Major facilitator superfamily MFS_1 [Mycolicibacterium smegmatis MC2 155]AIU05384.1 major facilitator transporter [Mycolicibacterium smegmatis MC2 155]AIU12009.1 major facilitator transporter [Mycolicibacterium smegmatis]AIU18633.1 major facilitator transporter [Mycolicibacterium smegmatis]
MVTAQPEPAVWQGHTRGSSDYRRLLAALFCAGVATFAQLYSPQAVLPLIASDLGTGAAHAALAISAATIGLAFGVLPWAALADRVGRVQVITVSVVVATVLGLLVPFAPTYALLLCGRFVEGLALAGVPAVAVAYLTEEINAGHAARAAGTYVAGTTIGGLAGRLVTGPVAEFAGWRVGVLTVALLCGMAALAFVKLAPAAQGFTPARTHWDLGRRLLTNLRSPRQLALFAQGFLLMGGFVAVYNFLGFRLSAAPFNLPQTVVSLVFLAYLAGTWASARAGAEATRFGRKPVLLVSIATMIAGVAVTMSTNAVVVLVGLVIATAGFFGAHAIASGWVGAEAGDSKAQASALYNLFYYGGSSAVGWLGGLAFDAAGWSAVAGTVMGLAALAGLIAFALAR